MLHPKLFRGHVRAVSRALAAIVALTLPLALNAPVQAATRPAAVQRALPAQLRALAAQHPALARWLRTPAAARFAPATFDPYINAYSDSVPVVRKACSTCKSRTESMSVFIYEDVATGNTDPVFVDVGLFRFTSKGGVFTDQSADYSYSLPRTDFSYQSDLSAFSLDTGGDLGTLGRINMTFAATSPASENCTGGGTGSDMTRPGSLSYGKFSFDTTNKFFGVIGGDSPNSEYPQTATLESYLGCTYPNHGSNICPPNGFASVAGFKGNASKSTAFYFDGDATSSGAFVFADSIIHAITKYGAFSDGDLFIFFFADGLPASDVQVQTEPTTAIQTTGDPLMVGSGHFTSTDAKQVYGPKNCKNPDGSRHTYTDNSYSGPNTLLSSDAGTGNKIVLRLDSGSLSVPVTPAGYRGYGDFYTVT